MRLRCSCRVRAGQLPQLGEGGAHRHHAGRPLLVRLLLGAGGEAFPGPLERLDLLGEVDGQQLQRRLALLEVGDDVVELVRVDGIAPSFGRMSAEPLDDSGRDLVEPRCEPSSCAM